MIAAIALVASAVQAQPVTFTHPCAHSSVVLAAFGREIGETIRPGGSVKKDYFLVRFDEMPIEDAKAAIAKTLNATWSRKGNVLYLTRTRAQELAEERGHRDRVWQGIDEAWAAAETRVNGNNAYTLEWLIAELRNQIEADEFSSYSSVLEPISRLADRILLSFTPEQIKRMPVGATFYSTDPNPWERPMPPEWMRLIRLMDEEAGVWQQANSLLHLKEYFVPDDSDDGGDDELETEVEINRSEDGFVTVLNISWLEMSMDSSDASAYKVMRPSQMLRFIEGVTGPLVLEGELREAWEWFSIPPSRNLLFVTHFYVPEPAIESFARPALVERIVKNIAANEPLAVFASQPFLQVAERKDLNLVALLSDSILGSTFYVPPGEGRDIQRSIGYTDYELLYEYDKALSVWSVRPREPHVVRKERTDRDDLSRLISDTDRNGWLQLGACRTFFKNSANLGIEIAWYRFLGAAVYNPNLGRYFSENSAIAVRLYSLLSSAAVNAVRSGGLETSKRHWPAGAERILNSYSRVSDRLMIEPPPTEGDRYPMNMYTRSIGDLLRQGLAMDATLRFELSERVIPRVMRTDGKVAHPNTVRRVLESTGFPEGGGIHGNIDWSMLAVELTEQLTVTLSVPGNGEIRFRTGFARPPRKNEFVPLEKLPEIARAAFDRTKKTD